MSQQRVALRYHGMVYGRDVEMAATDLIMTQFGRLQALPYDEADVYARRDGNPRNNTQDLTPKENLGPDYVDGIPDLDDLDDYNGYHATIDHIFNNVTYGFDMDISVRYVDPANLTLLPDTTYHASQSLAKEVTISVRETEIPQDRPPVAIQIRRIYSPAELMFH